MCGSGGFWSQEGLARQDGVRDRDESAVNGGEITDDFDAEGESEDGTEEAGEGTKKLR